MKTTNQLLFIFTLLISFVSCSDDDNSVVNEEETITTLNVTLTPVGGGDTVTLQSRDIDGDGPGVPVLTQPTGEFVANTTYNATVEFLNETENPAEDVTTEIREEDDEHQLVFVTTGSIGTTAPTDQDGNGNPVGLAFSLQTNDPGAGSLNITLRHEPTKPNDGTPDGVGGESEFQAIFQIQVMAADN